MRGSWARKGASDASQRLTSTVEVCSFQSVGTGGKGIEADEEAIAGEIR